MSANQNETVIALEDTNLERVCGGSVQWCEGLMQGVDDHVTTPGERRELRRSCGQEMRSGAWGNNGTIRRDASNPTNGQALINWLAPTGHYQSHVYGRVYNDQ